MKENINNLIHNLIYKVKKTEKKKISTSQKIKLYKKFSHKFKRGIKKKKISINSYNTYISRARRQFINLKHHKLKKNIKKLIKKFPVFKKEIKKIGFKKKIYILRKNINKLKIKLLKIKPLIKKINNIKISCDNTKYINNMVKKNKYWKNELKNLINKKWYKSNKILILKIFYGHTLLRKIEKLKINHEILCSLKSEKNKYIYVKKQNIKKLKKKKKNTITINYKNYMQEIFDLFRDNSPIDTIRKLSQISFALSAVSGRRMIEIVKIGKFKKVNFNKIQFYGQAKTVEKKKYIIYTLIESKRFIKKIKEVRKSIVLQKILKKIKNKNNKYQSINNQISNHLSNPFNKWVKLFFQDKNRTYKDSRSIYARICFNKWFKKDKTWENKDEDIFFYKILGHKSIHSQIHYKQFKLKKYKSNWIPNKNIYYFKRINNLNLLDNKLHKVIKRKASYKIHEITKKLIMKNPKIIINNYKLRKYGFNTRLIQRYIKFISKHIYQEKIKGRYRIKQNKNKIIV